VRRSRGARYWRNLALFTLFTLLLALVGVGLWLAHWRAMALVHPRRTRSTRTPSDLGVDRWETVGFPSADGLQLEGWFIPPAPEGDGATLIYVHGLGSHRGDLLEEAAMLAGHGYGALLFDLRGHGTSQGTVTTLGYAEVEDVRGAVAYLLARTQVNPDRIGLVGRSMGGAVAIRAAACVEEIRAVVAECAYASLEENIAEGMRAFIGLPPFPFAPLVIWFGERETGVHVRQVRPVDDVARIAPRAILFIHGERDGAIPVQNSLRLYQAARDPKALYVVPNAGHGGFLDAEPAEFERRVVEFLETYLRGR
jgi:fermentation-respiration switch protein FrsA (DUF1100 family)